MAAANEARAIRVHSSLPEEYVYLDTINDLKNYFLSIQDQLPTSLETFQFITKSPVFDIRIFINTTSGGSYIAVFKYAGKKLCVKFALYSLQGKEWSDFLKASIESCIDCVADSGNPEKLGETWKKDALALNKYTAYSCTNL